MDYMPDPVKSEAIEFFPHNAAATYASYTAFIRRTVEVMGSGKAARTWLDTPNEEFGNLTPLAYANQTGFDLSEFEPYFVRLEHGIFS